MTKEALSHGVLAMTGDRWLDVVFRSGMSSKSDLRGAIEAGVPVGVVAGRLSVGAQLLTLPRYLDKGGRVFV